MHNTLINIAEQIVRNAQNGKKLNLLMPLMAPVKHVYRKRLKSLLYCKIKRIKKIAPPWRGIRFFTITHLLNIYLFGITINISKASIS